MPIPIGVEDLCKEISTGLGVGFDAEGNLLVSLDDLTIDFLGGASISASLDMQVPNAGAAVKSILAQANAALAPLMPFFILMDAFVAVAKLAMAVPDALLPPDPSALLKLVPEVTAKLEKVLALLPPISIPKMVKKILLNIRTLLVEMRKQFLTMQVTYEGFGEVEARAAELEAEFPEISISLRASIGCGTEELDAQMQGLGNGMQPLKSLFGAVNILLQLAAVPVELPDPGSLGDGGVANISVTIDAIDVLVGLLDVAIVAIPV